MGTLARRGDVVHASGMREGAAAAAHAIIEVASGVSDTTSSSGGCVYPLLIHTSSLTLPATTEKEKACEIKG